MTEAREMSTDYPLHVHELVEGRAMPEMVERVALAIREDDGSPCIASTRKLCRSLEGCICRSLARAAIEAMRVPSEEMLSAAANDPHAHEGFTIWRAMITAALEAK